MAFVIYKKSRAPDKQSYAGPTWDAANIRHHYSATYSNRQWAETLADWLSKSNPVGFAVATV